MRSEPLPQGSNPELPAYLSSVTDSAALLVEVLRRGQRSRARRIVRHVLDAAAPVGVDPAEVLALTLAAIADPHTAADRNRLEDTVGDPR